MGLNNKINLKSQASTIRHEDREGLNTAERVGKVIEELIEATDVSLTTETSARVQAVNSINSQVSIATSAMQTAINNNELQSVSVTADNNSATLTVKSKGKTVTCSVPVARIGGAGFITGEQSQNLDAANKRDNTFPVETVNTLRAGSSLADGYLGGTFNEVETSIREIEHTLGIGTNSQIYA